MTRDELNQLDKNTLLLIDIREDDELLVEPSPSGAVHIPMAKVIKEAEAGLLPKEKKIITVCRSGGRCQIVNTLLAEKGYDVDYIEGGVSSLN